MTARSKARKRALDVLFEADQRGLDPVAVLADRLVGAAEAGQDGARPLPAYAVELVEGVTEHQPRIDEIVSSYAEGWVLDRMPAVDRTVLRIAVYELLWRADVPDAVAIDEAVELAKSLSTDESPRFINGVLGRIVLVKPPVQVAGPDAELDADPTGQSAAELDAGLDAGPAGQPGAGPTGDPAREHSGGG